LLEINRLEIKIAVPKERTGIYHEKVGIFIDQEGNYLAFSGSSNESKNAFENNYECIEVFTSWDEPRRAKSKKDHFESLWKNTNNGCLIFDFSKAAKEDLIRTIKRYHPIYDSIDSNKIFDEDEDVIISSKAPKIPSWLNLRDYQKKAINEWIQNDGQGLWAMATGSGKTITSLSAATHVLNSLANPVPLIVIVPYMHLVEQWASEGANFNIDFIKCNSDYGNWEKRLNYAITQRSFDSKTFISILTTTGTYKTKRFQDQIKKLDNILLIVDEAHNFGAKDIRSHYIENTRFRLGLSATPKRHMDDEGSQAILNYFGDVIFTYDLKDAIRDGNLTPYYYYPIFVNLTEDEEQNYYDLSIQISKQVAMGNDIDDPHSSLKILLMKRARIIASAANKIETLKELLTQEDLIHSKHNLFYTAAKIEKEEDGFEIRMVNKIVDLLREMGMQVDKFTSDESKDERKYLIDKLSDNLIDGLVAIKCLDEGVDIPSVERAFILSSSSNPKEFIQRRGRVLRQSKATGKKYAYIYDFIVIPNPDNFSLDPITLRMERNYLEKEFTRFQEFVEISENAYETEPLVLELKEKYHLLHI
jgi:DNA phosphorothioation system restriction enzyme